jgi:hypothetical protein
MNPIKEMSNEEVLHLRSRCQYLEMQNFNLNKKLESLRDEYRKKVQFIRNQK